MAAQPAGRTRDELDETFGAKEMGDFSHSVLEDFYRRFQESVGPKV